MYAESELFSVTERMLFLQNFSVNIDEFKSCLQVLSAKYDPDYMPKHVLNNDFSYC